MELNPPLLSEAGAHVSPEYGPGRGLLLASKSVAAAVG